ncbi:conserved hypothetical protein [Arthrobacter sp. 9AX]|uniref:DF family (seleno)protein n=1 Tax=Arthrobacter sp. 9AX TaxID=2653131 RepID=UPI0012F31E1D|nr:thioredoxin family protein [Arthrobacter sp. 9AX]VXC24298.1 conserved hypothetical protein [Arthrobacter sp. 9AX]
MTNPTLMSERLELLSWSGCPSHHAALTRLGEILTDIGHQSEPIHVRWIETEEDAKEYRFIGSPSIRVDGLEVIPASDPTGFGLGCRVYRTREGRFSPLPDRDELREQLEKML